MGCRVRGHKGQNVLRVGAVQVYPPPAYRSWSVGRSKSTHGRGSGCRQGEVGWVVVLGGKRGHQCDHHVHGPVGGVWLAYEREWDAWLEWWAEWMVLRVWVVLTV